MPYNRNDTRDYPRDERSRWRDERYGDRDWERGSREDRGFFERAGDEIASWFGDDDADRRRREDQRMEGRGRGRDDDRGRFWRDRSWGRGDYARDDERARFVGRNRDFDRGSFGRDEDRGSFGRSSYRGYGGGEGEYRGSMWGTEVGEPGVERGYRPMMAGYTRSEGSYSAADYPREDRSSELGRGYGERASSRGLDPHYHSWRQRQMDELDRDYDDYRRENQSRFESDFGSWRERRMQKRSLLGQIREHMEVVGSDDQHVGTVDKVAGDRIILTKSDPESGGTHHSLSCADIGRIDGDRVILDVDAEQAKTRWRDESRERALFEREDQGEMGDRALNRSFQGTYRE
jgi:hypothetical protein